MTNEETRAGYRALADLARSSGIPVRTLLRSARVRRISVLQPGGAKGRHYVAKRDVSRLLGAEDRAARSPAPGER